MRSVSGMRRALRSAAFVGVAGGTVFQVSSCSVDQSGAINAFADPAGLSSLSNQLFEASPVGQLLDKFHGSVDIHLGADE